MKTYTPTPGTELRGFIIRLYPDEETIDNLKSLQYDCRRAWNWLVKQTEDVIEARKAYAVKYGLVEAKPVRPDYNGMTPEESSQAKNNYIESSIQWNGLVHKAVDKLEGMEYRKMKELQDHYGCKHDYQLLQKVINWAYEEQDDRKIKPSSSLLQMVAKNYLKKIKGNRRKKFRRANDPMPLQVKSGDCFELGNFGARGGNESFYNCRIKFNGLKIKGRLPGKTPAGKVLEGVSIRKEADGWYGSIKVEVPIRVLPEPIKDSVIGIDVGLDNIAAFSDGTIIRNIRGKEFSNKIALMQQQKKDPSRLQQKASRHMRHVLHNEVVKKLLFVETIKLEKLNGRIGQMGGSVKISVMRKIMSLLTERYGQRVREVECAYTSQDCSQCGVRSKDTWSYDHGPTGYCPSCGYQEHRDVNAARNVAAKPMISLAV